MKYKAIIFDMDGTIINSEHLWVQAELDMLTRKTNLSAEECQQMMPELKGSSLYSSCQILKESFALSETVEELIHEKQQFAFQRFGDFVTFIDGFDRFHHKLSQINLKSAIATNATQASLDKILQHFPLQDFFNDHIYCIDHIGKKPKPHPDIFLFAAQQINVKPTECIVIEDSAHGIAAAKAANMFCIGINTGNDKETLVQADIIVDRYDEIELSKF